MFEWLTCNLLCSITKCIFRQHCLHLVTRQNKRIFAFEVKFYFVLQGNGVGIPQHFGHLIYVNISCWINSAPCYRTSSLSKYLNDTPLVYFNILFKLHHHYLFVVKLLLISKYRYTSENKKVTPYLFIHQKNISHVQLNTILFHVNMVCKCLRKRCEDWMNWQIYFCNKRFSW